MATITAGNELYLYQLLCREAGVGRQVMLSRIEEILLADDILPCDLGCSDVREVLEHLPAFVRLTVFKKGRVYATIVANEEWDAVLARIEKGEATSPKPTAKGGAKSWKRRKARKDPRPAKPKPKNRPVSVEAVEPEAGSAPEAGGDLAVTPEAKLAPEPLPETEVAPIPTPVPPRETEVPDQSEQAPEPEAEQAPEAVSEVEPAPELLPETEAEPASELGLEPAPEPGPEPEPEPVPAPEPTISLNITYDPYEYADEGLEPTEPEPAPQPEPPAQPAPSPTSQTRHPEDFAAEVAVQTPELSALYQILPLDVDPIALLDEDWRISRSTNTFTQENGLVSFPLRYLMSADPEAEPVRVHMRRTANRAGKRWAVEAVDHLENVGFEGLPTSGSDVQRELAQFAVLGAWDDIVRKLSEVVDPACTPFSADELREYLCITFHRIRCEQKVVAYDDDKRAAFDTGLLTADGQSVLMCFRAQTGDIPWEFVGFLTPDAAHLDESAAQPASYVRTLSDIVLSNETSVHIAEALVRAYGPAAEQSVAVALRKARRDYRLATPAYDPLRDEVRLLVPIDLPERETSALVLRPQANGFVASSIVSHEHAATCARIVSRELPRWLA